MTALGDDPSRGRIERLDPCLDEPQSRLVYVGVTVQDVAGRGPSEHHVQLGEAEDEIAGLVDQHDVEVVAELLGQPSGEFQAAEPRTEHHDLHAWTLMLCRFAAKWNTF